MDDDASHTDDLCRGWARWLRCGGPIVAGLMASALLGVLLPATAAAQETPIRWKACPKYSETTFKFLIGPDRLKEFKALWRRTQCGTVRVPLDYARPHGRKITVAFTRLRATDRAHRLGSLAVNPGGPGGSGYLMPLHMITSRNRIGAKLNVRYDLVGFDPRGVGYSSKVNCPDAPPEVQNPGPLSEADARMLYANRAKANQACVRTKSAFLRQLTTSNVARDLDRIRVGLHEKRISFLGVSWGTLLGAVYRSLFPSHVQRMWLDSPAAPYVRLDAYEDGRARAMAEDFARFTAWLAARNATFGFGATAEDVMAALTRLREELDANPRVYTDLPQTPIDGNLVAQAAGGFTLSWPLAGPLLKALRDAPSGTKAPAPVRLAFGGMSGGEGPSGGPGGTGGPRPPADLPEDMNPTMHEAALCNDDSGRRDFDSAWADWQKRLRLYPVTGEAGFPSPQCAGWTLPVHPLPLRRTSASLVMSVHRYEMISPFPWGVEMQHAIGGQLLTVEDDVHSSAAAMPSDCAPKIAVYFATGRLNGDHCQGILVPKVSEAPPPEGV